MKTTLILACAGKGERAGFNKNKLLIKAGLKTVLEQTLSAFIKTGLIKQYIVCVSKEDETEIKGLLPHGVETVIGGSTRTQSIKNALSLVNGETVLIHDGARPFVSERVIKECIERATEFGSAIPVVPTRDTVLSGESGKVKKYLGKSNLYCVQTPQGFNAERIKKAYALSEKPFNDDGEVYKEYFGELHYYEGDIKNVKLTYREDFDRLWEFNGERFGIGFDCHKLVENRKLILGGVEIPHDKGLLGHSDADVLTHAIMDAILSSLSMRDIGFWFPDSDEKYKGANSIELLKEVLKMIAEKGYKVKTVSAVIMAEKPKLLKHIPAITENLSSVMNIQTDSVGISATTLEGLGFIGREEGICVKATATLEKK